jgi:hypothetical protein
MTITTWMRLPITRSYLLRYSVDTSQVEFREDEKWRLFSSIVSSPLSNVVKKRHWALSLSCFDCLEVSIPRDVGLLLHDMWQTLRESKIKGKWGCCYAAAFSTLWYGCQWIRPAHLMPTFGRKEIDFLRLKCVTAWHPFNSRQLGLVWARRCL